MEIVKRQIQIGDQPSSELLKEIQNAVNKEIFYDQDSPKLSSEELSTFEPVHKEFFEEQKIL